MIWHADNAEFGTLPVAEIKRELAKRKLKASPPPLESTVRSSITSKATTWKKWLIHRYVCKYRPYRFFPLEGLPFDIVYMLLPYLSLVDTACLALVSRYFYFHLQKYARRINEFAAESSPFRHDFYCKPCSSQRFEFLQRVDVDLSDWYLCKYCYKYYGWSHGKTSTHNCRRMHYDVADCGNIRLGSTHRLTYEDIQLVMRARHYNSKEYGLPLETLNRTVQDRAGWTTTTTAMFDSHDDLIVRIVCEPSQNYPDRYSVQTEDCRPVPRARCCELYSRSLVTFGALQSECNKLHRHGLWHRECPAWSNGHGPPRNKDARCEWDACNPGYYECDGCGAIFGLRLACSMKKHSASIVFYRSLGNVSTYNDVPKTVKLRVAQTTTTGAYGGRTVSVEALESEIVVVRRMEALFAAV